MRIDKPGLYNLSDANYFSDPAPKPSLTQSLAKILLERSPRHMWYAHPRLNPQWLDAREVKYDLGTVAHALLFGPGKPISIIDAPDWRTKKAREDREQAITDGKQPVLVGVYERAKEMADAFTADVDLPPLAGGAEICAISKDSDVWLRTKIDWINKDYLLVLDYKTTSQQLRHDQIGAYAWQRGWHIQAAMHTRILDKLQPLDRGRRQHYFALQETYKPYACYMCQIAESMMEMGRIQIWHAMQIFRTCLRTNEWPGPSKDTLYIEAPSWAVHQDMQQRELFEEEQENGKDGEGRPGDIIG